MLASVAATLAYGESEAVPDEREDDVRTLVVLVAVTGSSTPVVAAAVAATLTSGKSRGAFK